MRSLGVAIVLLMGLPGWAAKCPSDMDSLTQELSELRVSLVYFDPKSEEYAEVRDEYTYKSIQLVNETSRVEKCLGIRDDPESDIDY